MDKKLTSSQIREIYLNKPPEGMTKRDIKNMPEEYLLDMHHHLNETLDDIFDNAQLINFYDLID